MKTHTEDEQLRDELRSKVWNHWRWGWNDALKDEWTPEQEAKSKEIIEQWVTNLEKLITTLRLKDRLEELETFRKKQGGHNLEELCCDLCDRIDELKQLLGEGEK